MMSGKISLAIVAAVRIISNIVDFQDISLAKFTRYKVSTCLFQDGLIIVQNILVFVKGQFELEINW